MNTDIFTEKLNEFLITQPEIHWDIEKDDYPFLLEHNQKILLLISISNMFSLIYNFSSIIEIIHITADQIITEIGTSCQDMLIEKIEKDFME